MVKISMRKSTSDLKAITVAELKKYLQDPGVSVSGYLKCLWKSLLQLNE